ncbi:metallophosphoesterase [Natrialba swarupiae]|uniref:Metallophosphoesterase n=1 Tax=Natrialba swarupiae TaxID=2448032 RepID=A0A5D5AJL4_9EURY|nr:metallophosphoesterase [Natrialba swarupiae]TYT61364.1 metallophosphoesterase [Natrialba swarupiae]
MDADRPTPKARVDPVPGEPAAIATVGCERALLVADYHAGYEDALRYERGVDVPGRAPDRRERVLSLVDRVDPDRFVVLGDLMHSIGDPGGAERGELEVLFESLPTSLDVTIVKGNHDGLIETWLGDGEPTEIDGDDSASGADSGSPAHDGDTPAGSGRVTIVPGDGVRLGGLGVCHGHTWPAPAVLESDVLCLGHEHPCVRLEDEIGGSRVERAWLRGRVDPGPFRDRPEYDDVSWLPRGRGPKLVVVPAFNDLVGGTWVNVPDQSFLSPFLPEGLVDGEAYLLDGTRLGAYGAV